MTYGNTDALYLYKMHSNTVTVLILCIDYSSRLYATGGRNSVKAKIQSCKRSWESETGKETEFRDTQKHQWKVKWQVRWQVKWWNRRECGGDCKAENNNYSLNSILSKNSSTSKRLTVLLQYRKYVYVNFYHLIIY